MWGAWKEWGGGSPRGTGFWRVCVMRIGPSIVVHDHQAPGRPCARGHRARDSRLSWLMPCGWPWLSGGGVVCLARAFVGCLPPHHENGYGLFIHPPRPSPSTPQRPASTPLLGKKPPTTFGPRKRGRGLDGRGPPSSGRDSDALVLYSRARQLLGAHALYPAPLVSKACWYCGLHATPGRRAFVVRVLLGTT